MRGRRYRRSLNLPKDTQLVEVETEYKSQDPGSRVYKMLLFSEDWKQRIHSLEQSEGQKKLASGKLSSVMAAQS